jgi:hypothetical protein
MQVVKCKGHTSFALPFLHAKQISSAQCPSLRARQWSLIARHAAQLLRKYIPSQPSCPVHPPQVSYPSYLFVLPHAWRAAHPSREYSPGTSACAVVAAQYSLHLLCRLHAASLGHGPPISLAAGAPALLFTDAPPVALLPLSPSLWTP